MCVFGLQLVHQEVIRPDLTSSHGLRFLPQWIQSRWPNNTLTFNTCHKATHQRESVFYYSYSDVGPVYLFSWLWALLSHALSESAIFHTHTDCAPHAPLVLKAEQDRYLVLSPTHQFRGPDKVLSLHFSSKPQHNLMITHYSDWVKKEAAFLFFFPFSTSHITFDL